MSIPEEWRAAEERGIQARQEYEARALNDDDQVVNEVGEDGQEEGERPVTPPVSVPKDSTAEQVKGERGIPSVSRERSIHARITNALTIGIIAALGIGFLSWYYSNAFMRRSDETRRVKEAATASASGEVKLPPLTQVSPPPQPRNPQSLYVSSPDNPDNPATAQSLSQLQSHEMLVQREEAVGAPPPVFERTLSADESARLRVLNSPVLYRPTTGNGLANTTSPVPTPDIPAQYGAGLPSTPHRPSPTGVGGGNDSLGALLQITSPPAVQAQVMPTRQLLMPKGAFIDCTLETALNSELPGMTTCITATDIFGADGHVVLLERGSKLVGETRGETRLGRGRVFVLWTEARTPTGVVVELASPGTDELGRSGLPGYVDTHFWERFGSAILISVIDGAIQAIAAGQNNGSGGSAVVYNAQGSRDVMTEVLRNTINIPPTVVKNQGERIQVLVARDLDFRSVYALRPRTAR